jgi:hypothetical protein
MRRKRARKSEYKEDVEVSANGVSNRKTNGIEWLMKKQVGRAK